MQNFNIGSYETFSSGATIVISCTKSLRTDVDNSDNQISSLKAGVFEGPIADNVKKEWDMIAKTLVGNIIQLSSASNYLNIASSNYQSADSTNASNIGSV